VYDPEVGRWLTPDPLGFADGPNLYAYVHNNPLTFVDPDGLFTEEAKDFLGSTMHSFVEDSTWGASSYFVGERNYDTTASRAGMYAGVATSLVVGAVTGGLEARIAKEAFFAFNSLHRAYQASSAVKTIKRGHNVVQIEKAALGSEKVRSVAGNAGIIQKEASQLNRFDSAARGLTQEGKDNIRTLRGWAKSKGWEKYSAPGKPEKWGKYNSAREEFDWMLKIKPEGSFRPGLDGGSSVPRFDARINAEKNVYINPFKGEVGGRSVGTHVPLNKR